jgi:N-acetylneuraminate synthase
MVTAIRNTEKALGRGEKEILEVEEELHDMARRRIHASEDIEEGEELTEENIAVLRSGGQNKGLVPKFYDEVIGKKASSKIEKDSGVTWDDIKQKE